jgi:ABC-type Co2+ transport system permease subunit
MHIEPGVVDGAKLALSYATAAGAIGLGLKMAAENLKTDGGLSSLALRSVATTALVFCFFEVLPHYPVGVSEVHLILGSTLFLLFGAGAASIGLAAGLLIQGLLFAPFDLPQYGMNVTTLLVPLWVVSALAKRIIAPRTPYVDLSYAQALALSTAYQGGVVGWVAFWAFYGQGFGVENLASVGAFGAAYMTVILIEPLADLAVLASAKAMRKLTLSPMFADRLHSGTV